MPSLHAKPIKNKLQGGDPEFSSCGKFPGDSSVSLGWDSQNMVPEPVALESVGYLLETQILWPSCRPLESENPRGGPQQSVFEQALRLVLVHASEPFV